MVWVINQNIEVALNGVKSRHNILHKQIVRKPGLVDDKPNLIHDPIGEPTPPLHPHHRHQICDGFQEFQ